MKIGRNDACPCGSGKKYKQCCLKRLNRSEYDLIREAVIENQSNDKIADLLCIPYRYMNEKQWMGACYAGGGIALGTLLQACGQQIQQYFQSADAKDHASYLQTYLLQ